MFLDLHYEMSFFFPLICRYLAIPILPTEARALLAKPWNIFSAGEENPKFERTYRRIVRQKIVSRKVLIF